MNVGRRFSSISSRCSVCKDNSTASPCNRDHNGNRRQGNSLNSTNSKVNLMASKIKGSRNTSNVKKDMKERAGNGDKGRRRGEEG